VIFVFETGIRSPKMTIFGPVVPTARLQNAILANIKKKKKNIYAGFLQQFIFISLI